MQEIFYEESARTQNEKSASRKYYIFKSISIISYIFMVLWIILVFTAFPFGQGNIFINILIVLVPCILFFLSGFLLGKFKNKFYVDYDYTFVTGSIRIAKVIKNIKRSFVIKFETSAIEKLGKYASDTYEKYSAMPGVTKLILTSNVTPDVGKDFYYLVINIDGNKKLLIMECTETFMVHVLRYSNKAVLEEDFKWFT